MKKKNQVSEKHPFLYFGDVPWFSSQLVASGLQDSLGWQQGNCLQICNTLKQCNSSSVWGNDYVLCWGSFSLRWSHIGFKSDMPQIRLAEEKNLPLASFHWLAGKLSEVHEFQKKRQSLSWVVSGHKHWLTGHMLHVHLQYRYLP